MSYILLQIIQEENQKEIRKKAAEEERIQTQQKEVQQIRLAEVQARKMK